MAILLTQVLAEHSGKQAAGEGIPSRLEDRGNLFRNKGANSVPEVSIFRLNLLRAMYLYMFVGLAIFKWPGIFNPPPGILLPGSVVGSVLCAISLLALLGIRYPLRMLRLLFFEFLWKAMWVVGWGLPLWFPGSQDTLVACLMGVILVPLVMPWPYVLKQYVKAPGDPWHKKAASVSPERPSSSAIEVVR